jgi:hypothetical protein
MAGLIAALFGGRSRPPDPDPLPGQGGYTLPRGPYGATGYPGSAPAAPPTHGQDLGDAKLPSRRNVSTDRIRTVLQDSNPRGEFFGGQPLKSRPGIADNIGLNPPEVRQTEFPRTIEGRYLDISAGVPGNSNQRNTRYYGGRQAAPGLPASAGPGDSAGGPNRYVFNGPNGGYQSYQFTREMPFSGRGNGARGAQLSGLRYYADRDQFTAQEGAYGQARAAGPNHRPTVWIEPAPWTASYYDTTASTGSPDQPGSDGQVVTAVYQSPDPGRASSWRRGG